MDARIHRLEGELSGSAAGADSGAAAGDSLCASVSVIQTLCYRSMRGLDRDPRESGRERETSDVSLLSVRPQRPICWHVQVHP